MYIIVTDNKQIAQEAEKKGARVIEFNQTNDIQKNATEDDKVERVMCMFAFKPNLKGYYYLKYIFEKCLVDAEYHKYGVTKWIYPDVAKKYETTSSKVERAIRHSILRSFEQMSEKYEELFNYKLNSPPTVSEFISAVSENILRN